MLIAYVTLCTLPSLSMSVPVTGVRGCVVAAVPFSLPSFNPLAPASPSRIPGDGSSGNVPSPGVRPPDSPLVVPGDPVAFVGDGEGASSCGRRFAVELAGSPSLIACFCCATAIGDLMSR